MKLLDWIGFLALIIALIILWQFRGILLLVFMAAVVAIAINSLVRWLQQRWNLQRSTAVSIALSLVLMTGIIVLGVVFPPFITQVLKLGELIPLGIERVSNWQQGLQYTDLDAQLPDWFPPIQEVLDELQLPPLGDVVQEVGGITQRVFSNFLTFFSSTAAIALQLLLVFVLILMMVGDPQAYRNLLLRLFPSFYRRRADDILSKCEQVLLAWMGGVLLSSIFVAITCAIGLSFLGIDLVFAHALLAGLFNIIPNIGPTLSVIFPVFVALIDSPGRAIGVVILYLVVQNVESYWFSPMVMRQQVSLLPAATLIAQLFFATFLGPVGLILALPLTVVSKVWIEEAFIHDILDQWTLNPRLSSSSSSLTSPHQSAIALSSNAHPGENPNRTAMEEKEDAPKMLNHPDPELGEERTMLHFSEPASTESAPTKSAPTDSISTGTTPTDDSSDPTPIL
ncbi:MAG: AI-2E family transporter [Merismopedia sp. SIO2A8]|nr:AI-2E family transporter [Symploca sp. SIO2B6]NET52375.1 AI-2E family transporter [Merismopedia sp. SIO2A8]